MWIKSLEKINIFNINKEKTKMLTPVLDGMIIKDYFPFPLNFYVFNNVYYIGMMNNYEEK